MSHATLVSVSDVSNFVCTVESNMRFDEDPDDSGETSFFSGLADGENSSLHDQASCKRHKREHTGHTMEDSHLQ